MPESERKARILVAGMGNDLLRDDGAGVHAVRHLAADPPPGAVVAEIGTAVLGALHLLEQADLVLAIDAMQAGGAPGTVYRCALSDLEDVPAGASLHQLGLAGAARLLLPERRPRIAVIGIEPECIDYGMELTAAVERALPQAVALARSIVREWRGDAPVSALDYRKTRAASRPRKRGGANRDRQDFARSARP